MAALLFFLRFGRLPHASPLRQGANRFPKAWNTVTYNPTGEPCPKDAGDDVGHCIRRSAAQRVSEPALGGLARHPAVIKLMMEAR